MLTITLFDDFGYTQYREANLKDTEIDASAATWIVSNSGDDQNRYPVLITDSENVILTGGEIDGTVPLDLAWEQAYVNSAAVFARDSDNITFQDWTISEAWDGIRITGADDATFTVENVWFTNIRDDAIENDRGLSGTIKDVLMDGVFVGISLYEGTTANQTDQTVTLDNVLIRMESFEYRGEETHQPFFKFQDGVSPNLSITDSVFAIDRVDHREYGRLQDAWDSVTESENNYLLNLSDEPLPDNYPMPPEGFTILQGEEARIFWEEVRADWLAEFRGIGEVPTETEDPVPAPEAENEEPDPEPVPDVEEPEPEPEVEEPESEVEEPEPAPESEVEEPEPAPEPDVEEPEPEPAPEVEEPDAEPEPVVEEPEPEPVPDVEEPEPEPEPEPGPEPEPEPEVEEPEPEPTPDVEEFEPEVVPDVEEPEPELVPEIADAPVVVTEEPVAESDPIDEPDTKSGPPVQRTPPNGKSENFFEKFLSMLKSFFGRGKKDKEVVNEDEADAESAELALSLPMLDPLPDDGSPPIAYDDDIGENDLIF